MKSVTSIFAAFGMVCLGLVLLRAVIADYREMAVEEFASEESIVHIRALYEKAELEGVPSEYIKYFDPEPPFVAAKKIPSEWVPVIIKENWSQWTGGEPYADVRPYWGDVVAYFGENEKLLAIEFYGSRYGCMVSRYPSVAPARYESPHRVASHPLFVSLRISGSD